jgi:uncharacterized RDD family membrane protein YckC
MKCPKCGYLGFEPVDRCRNCGYDFSLSAALDEPELPELSLRRDTQTLRPLEDLALLDSASNAPPIPAPSQASPKASRSELPLFGASGGIEDAPLITRVSPPRPPLAVRRATPEVPRLRSEPRMHTLDLDLGGRVAPSPSFDAGARAHPTEWPPTEDVADSAENAGLGARFVAAAIDILILLAVDAIVIYFTVQICGISVSELDQLPKAPLLAFLLVQNGGYLVVFTAGGQTLGKMAAGIKVVADGSGSPLDLGRAFLRTAIWLVLAIPAGLGFLSALFSSDHRGLHDRFAGTRVVRASA